MLRQSSSTLVVLCCLAAFWSAGCFSENPASETDGVGLGAPEIISVVPENGAYGVDRDTEVTIRFSGPMDTASVNSNCYLSGGSDMLRWLDSLEHMPGMMNGMGDSACDHMMSWMDSMSYSGRFEWNANLDSCVFHPDSALLPNCDHLLYMRGEMLSRNGQVMAMDSGSHGGLMMYFQTGP
jgi:hypothetical protein